MSAPQKKIGVAIVGYGYWSPNLIRNIKKIPECEIIAICEKDETKHEKIVREQPDLTLYRHYRDAFTDEKVDAVVVGTIPSSHYRIAKMALEHGKHVLVEKPLALSVTHARELEALARKKKLVLMVDHTFVYSPEVETLRTLIQGGTLGQKIIAFDSVRTNLGLFQRDTSVLWDLAPHDISILLYVLGKMPTHVIANGIKPVAHRGLPKQHEGIAYLHLYFADGLAAHVHVSWFAPEKIRRVTIAGDQKMAVYDLLAPDGKVKVFDKRVLAKHDAKQGEPLFEYVQGAHEVHGTPSDREDLEHMLRDFKDAILKKQTPRSHASFGLAIVRVLKAAERSLNRDGKKIKIRRLIELPDSPEHFWQRLTHKVF